MCVCVCVCVCGTDRLFKWIRANAPSEHFQNEISFLTIDGKKNSRYLFQNIFYSELFLKKTTKY